MEEIKIGVQKALSIPSAINAVVITHEWGDVVSSATGLTPLGTYNFTPDSIGIHKVQWKTGSTIVSTVFYSAYAQLLDFSQFLDDNPELSDFEDLLPAAERLVRHVIQNYTNQKFGPFVAKTMEIQGDGGESLYLPTPITTVTSITNSYGDNITDLVEICPNEPTLLQRTARFRGAHYYDIKRDVFWNRLELFNERYTFTIVGNWGHDYVPLEVTEATIILLKQALSGDDIAQYQFQGLTRVRLGDFDIRFGLKPDAWGTTGNGQADNLLAAYVSMGIGLI